MNFLSHNSDCYLLQYYVYTPQFIYLFIYLFILSLNLTILC